MADRGSSALLTDKYELTMLEAALRQGTAGRQSVFEVFARRLPEGRRYGVVGGTGRLLDLIEDFRFGPDEVDYLGEHGVVSPPTIDWLASYTFKGTIWGYGEGECYVPGSPLLVVEGSFADAVLLETLVLSVLNHDSAIAAAAARMITAAGSRPCIEMGSRRTHELAAVAAARAAYVAGFASTSNLEAARSYGIPSAGTAAHAFTLLHDDERAAFTAQIAAQGPGTTVLVDTFDVTEAVRLAVEIAGPELGAVRLDSGDLIAQARAVRAQLDSLGAVKTRIVVTSDLDEHQIAALAAAPVDGYGVGTNLVTGSGAPTAGLVYKLVSRAVSEEAGAPMISVEKRSSAKTSVGGRKWALRRRSPTGVAEAEVLGVEHVPEDDGDDRRLMRLLVEHGDLVGREPLADARARHAASLAELPPEARQLSRGEPAIPTMYDRASRSGS